MRRPSGYAARGEGYEEAEALHCCRRVRIGTVLCFVLGAVAMGSSGVGVLIPETGRPGLDWIADVEAAGGLFFTGRGWSS
jgi:hypothetical protein